MIYKVLSEFNDEIPVLKRGCDPAIPLLGICLQANENIGV